MSKIGIIDYGMGNLGSVSNACKFLNLSAEIVAAPDRMDSCAALILPGVGAFGDCMAHLRDYGFIDPIKEWIASDRPFLGICLGLQVLFDSSEESPDAQGLGILPGSVKLFQASSELKVPQIGWSRVRQVKPACPLFQGIADESHFYFVHSYYARPADENVTAGTTAYGVTYASAVWQSALMAVQFHPEKSQQLGLQMLKNFSQWVDEGDA